MDKNTCYNCGEPTKQKLCPQCYLEAMKRKVERQYEIQKEINKEGKRWLYGD